MKKVLGLGKKKVRAGKSTERGEPGDMTSEDHQERRKGKQISRRRFLEGVAGGTVAGAVAVGSAKAKQVKDAGEAGLRAGLDTVINADEPVPADLRHKTRVSRQGHKVLGFGHSEIAGAGDNNTPLVDIIRDDLRGEGVRADSVSGAVSGSTVYDLEGQWNNTKGKVGKKKPGTTRDVNIWTGGNEVPPEMIATAQKIRRNPFSLGLWGRFRQQADDYQRTYERSLRKGSRKIVRESEADSAAFYGFPNLQDAKAINQITKGKTMRIDVAGESLGAKFVQAFLAILTRKGTRSVYTVARQVRDETGIEVTALNPGELLTPSDYDREGVDDQHFGGRGARRIAAARAKRSRIENN